MKNNNSKIGFGGGCHWCTEAVFQSLAGVVRVEQGYIGSVGTFKDLSEAVIVHFSPNLISLKSLVEIHLYTHKSSSEHSMRKKYRSAIYVFSKGQKIKATQYIEEFKLRFSAPIITTVLPFQTFEPSRESITNYYKKNPSGPFCERFIAPKLRLLQEQFKDKTYSVIPETSMQPHG